MLDVFVSCYFERYVYSLARSNRVWERRKKPHTKKRFKRPHKARERLQMERITESRSRKTCNKKCCSEIFIVMMARRGLMTYFFAKKNKDKKIRG